MIVSFFLRTTASGKKSLYVRLTKDKTSTEILLDYVPERKNSSRIDYYKKQVYDQVIALHNEQVLRNKPADPKSIKHLYLAQTKARYLLATYWEYVNAKIKPRVQKEELSPSSLQKYTVVYNHLKDFLQCRKLDDINLVAVDREFIDAFDDFLRQFNGHNTAIKHLAYLKAILRYAIEIKGYLLKNPFDGVKLTKKKHNAVYLEKDELLRLIAKKTISERLQKVRDLFVFQCFTGLAFSDMNFLRPEDIHENYIKIHRKKTNEPAVIYLYTVAKKILQKYNYALPLLSNQKMNEYLKELAELCNINKQLTSHMARHTYATTINLNNGVPMEIVRTLLGHSTIKQTEHYAKVLSSTVITHCTPIDKILQEDFKVKHSKFCSTLKDQTPIHHRKKWQNGSQKA